MAAHAGTHERGGNDPIRLDDLAEPQDNVDLNSNTLRHGLLPKLSGNSTDSLQGNGTWGSGGNAASSDHFVTTQAESDLSAEFSLGSLTTGMLKHSVSAGVSTPATASAGTDYVAPGAITSSGLTQATARLLGRTTASSGAIEEITVGSGLSLSSGSLTATGTGSLNSASAGASSDTNGTTNTMVDVTGASISLAAGTWILWGSVTVETTSASYVLCQIADGSNNSISCGMGSSSVAGTAKTAPAIAPVIVTPGSTTTYKLRFQTALNGTNGKALKDVDASNLHATGIVALKIA